MPTFFKTPAELRAWFARHAGSATELIAGFHKKGTGLPSITWPESVDEALCVGWIDGIRKGIDATSYQIRFTPRKATSTWSAVNIERVRVLTAEGRMTEAGLAAFARRREEKSGIYAYEQAAHAELDAASVARFKRQKKAWAFFEAQSGRWRHQMAWRILSAKQAATRERRLALLIEACAQGTRL